MKRELLKTADGSATIHLPDINEQYHSKHGALQESKHVFIAKGLHKTVLETKNISLLEIGFGTGLNALLTFFEAKSNQLNVDYTTVEAFPVSKTEWEALDYGALIPDNSSKEVYKKLHTTTWEEKHAISSFFHFTKQQKKFEEITDMDLYDLIYFDAFGARVQPELWTEEIFDIMFRAMKENGILVTYAAKGSVRRAMQAVGFTVERLEGPPGKREMLRATRITK